MKRAIIAATAFAASAMLAITGIAAPPKATPADAPLAPAVVTVMEKQLHWGMSHQEVTDVYNNPDGLFDREYAPQIGKLQPGVLMQQLEADKENRKTNFQRSFTTFTDTPTGYDITPLRSEYTYKNDEALQRLFKGERTRFFFYIRDKLWKILDEIPLKPDGRLGASYQDAVTKLNALFGVPGRVRAPDPAQGLERTTTDWQYAQTHCRLLDRSSEHLVALVLEDKTTLANLATLRAVKATDPFAIDPSIAAVTKGGISDPNAGKADAGKIAKRK